MRQFGLAAAAATALFCMVTPGIAPAKPGGLIEEKKAAILHYLKAEQGMGKALSGTQVNEFEVFLRCNSMDRVEILSGKTPSILGAEMMGVIESKPYAVALQRTVIDHAAKGGIVELSWHWRNPLATCLRGEVYECTTTPMSDQDFDKMLTQDTPEHQKMLRDIDAIGHVLQQLQNNGVVVLWRPLHEMNGGWFWWGKKDHFVRLWNTVYERLTTHFGLKNLIWVWSPDKPSPDVLTYYPQVDRPDIIGSDIYVDDANSPVYGQAYDTYSQLDKGQFAYTEVGVPPSPSAVKAFRPMWILIWGGEFLNKSWKPNGACDACNTEQGTAEFFKRADIVNLDEMPMDVKSILSKKITGVVKRKAECSAPLM